MSLTLGGILPSDIGDVILKRIRVFLVVWL